MTHSPIVYLFLDFDGVAHPMFAGSRHQEWEKHPFCYLPELEAAIRRARQPVRIVIASTWRKKRDLDALRKPFSPDIAALVVGKTPEGTIDNQPGARLAEVQAWMKAHARPEDKAVAIDDMGELYLGPDGQTDQIALVACPDRFGAEQWRALNQAIADPDGWILSNPIVRREGLIVVGG